MPHGSQGIKHLHERKISTAGKIKEAVLSKRSNLKQIVDKMVLFTGLSAVIMTIPQVTHIWFHQSAAGVSFVTWMTYFGNAVIWAFYGIVHKEMPIILMYVSFIVLDALVILGILTYS